MVRLAGGRARRSWLMVVFPLSQVFFTGVARVHSMVWCADNYKYPLFFCLRDILSVEIVEVEGDGQRVDR